jgi:hypothetical protein
VDKIRTGSSAAAPVEEPTKFELVINRETTKAFLLDPPIDVVRADEAIEASPMPDSFKGRATPCPPRQDHGAYLRVRAGITRPLTNQP